MHLAICMCTLADLPLRAHLTLTLSLTTKVHAPPGFFSQQCYSTVWLSALFFNLSCFFFKYFRFVFSSSRVFSFYCVSLWRIISFRWPKVKTDHFLLFLVYCFFLSCRLNRLSSSMLIASRFFHFHLFSALHRWFRWARIIVKLRLNAMALVTWGSLHAYHWHRTIVSNSQQQQPQHN